MCECCCTGVDEEAADLVKRFGACSCRVVSLENVAKARMTSGSGLVKLVIAPDSGRVLGMHVVSPNAAEYITEAALYIIVDTIHVFPKYAEALKLSAQAFLRPVEKMSCCVE